MKFTIMSCSDAPNSSINEKIFILEDEAQIDPRHAKYVTPSSSSISLVRERALGGACRIVAYAYP